MANHLGTFRSDIRRMEESIRKADQTCQDMFEEVEELTAMWRGPAHDAYRRQFLTDYENMKRLLTYLKEYAGHLRDANEKYTTCEDRVRELIVSVRM